MPRPRYDEDLFKDSTMTFGEHLEELRLCLFRALLGLMLGFTIGLIVGNWVMKTIQYPLVAALEEFYESKSKTDTLETLARLKEEGKALPAEPEQIEPLIDEHLLPEVAFIQPDALIGPLKERYPEQMKDFKVPEKAPDPTDESAAPKPKPITKNDLVQVFIWRPVGDKVRVVGLKPEEAFMIYIKASLLAGAILSSPWIFFQIWSFVAAGLYPHEKRYVHLFLPISLTLFLGGAFLAFFAVFPPVLKFLFNFSDWVGITPDPRISEWLGLVMALPIGFGLAFQLPLVMLFLERIGIFTVQSYTASWRISVLAIFVISMVLTPADPYSMFLMAVPLLVLYLGGVLMCKLMPRRQSPYDEA